MDNISKVTFILVPIAQNFSFYNFKIKISRVTFILKAIIMLKDIIKA